MLPVIILLRLLKRTRIQAQELVHAPGSACPDIVHNAWATMNLCDRVLCNPSCIYEIWVKTYSALTVLCRPTVSITCASS